MKRQAEKQLVKDDDEVEDEDSSNQGFKKADESVLATRVIRGLPKRTGSAPQIPTSNTATTVTPPPIFATNTSTGSGSFKFESTSTAHAFAPSGFSGFTSNKPSATDATGSSSSILTNPFASPPSTLTPPSTKSTFSSTFQNPPAMPSTATSTSKAFAASISGSSANAFGALQSNLGTSAFSRLPPAAQPSSTAAISVDGDDSAPLLKYYTDLRGLNMSFLAAISKAVEGDPFFDISTFSEKYKSIRQKIQEDLDSSTKSTPTSLPTSTSSPSTSKSAMPAPPSSFSGFDGFKSAAPSATPFNPPKSTPLDFKALSSGFGSSSAANPFALKDSSTNSFGASPLVSDTASQTASSSSPFLFGGSRPSTSSSAFGSFGTTSPSPTFNVGTTSSQPAKSIFGSGSGTTSSSPFGSSSSDKPTSSNIFGSSDTSAVTQSPFSLPSATKDSVKSPVHFGFGSSSAPTAFGTVKSSTGEHSPDGESSERATPAAEGTEGSGDTTEPPPVLSTHNPHDEEGEGEENEETVHNVKSKVYRLSKAEDGSVKWIVLGAGILRLKKDKETGARRMLARNSTNGKVIINFALYSGLKPLPQGKNALNFVGHEAGASQTYSVRVANEDDASRLKSVLEREIAFVKAKEDS